MFVWTTGAWLIWDHLEARPPVEVARLERAIERGLIRWHAPALHHAFRADVAGVVPRRTVLFAGPRPTLRPQHRRRQDDRCARPHPWHRATAGRGGIRFLHLGVNTASPIPDVPDLFRWRVPGGEEVVVMYQRSYGETHFPEGFADGLGFAHTSDNIGPQSVPQTIEVHREMAPSIRVSRCGRGRWRTTHPSIWPRREELPVVEDELGDSWIHGTASDPMKLARFRAVQRLYDTFEDEGTRQPRRAFGRGLTLVAEHTWGVDVKTYLRDERAWDRPDFERSPPVRLPLRPYRGLVGRTTRLSQRRRRGSVARGPATSPRGFRRD